jgi:hypothetical protein
MNTKSTQYPAILDRWFKQSAKGDPEHAPRKTVRRFHGLDVSVWQGKVHFDTVKGWDENTRLKHFITRWRIRTGKRNAMPTTDDIYSIMIDADNEKGDKEKEKPFNLNRLAENIARNNVTEPIVLYLDALGNPTLWDGNRRFFATMHIMNEDRFADCRQRAQWIPCYIYQTSGDPEIDADVRKKIITEHNFVEKDQITWPNYVRAAETVEKYENLLRGIELPTPIQQREAKKAVTLELGLPRNQANRWISMFHLAQEFKDYCENTHEATEDKVELFIQEKFEYFDELSKGTVIASFQDDPDRQSDVFDWLWQGKFKSWPDVRDVPRVLNDPIARSMANREDSQSFREAIKEANANDPARIQDKEMAGEKIKNFSKWLRRFDLDDLSKIDRPTLEELEKTLGFITAMLRAAYPADKG